MNIQTDDGDNNVVAQRLGQALARIRKQRGMSQSALGDQLKLAQPTVSKMESGYAPIDVVLLCRWARVLAIEPWVLLAEAAGTPDQAAIVKAVADMAREEPRAWTTMRLLLTRPVRDTVE